MDIFICILTVTGIVLVLYWGGVGVKSLFKKNPHRILSNKRPSYMDIVKPVSEGDYIGNFAIRNGKYEAYIGNRRLRKYKFYKADSIDELRKKIDGAFHRWAKLG